MNDSTRKDISNRIIAAAVEMRATDIHVDPTLKGFHVRVRVDGVLYPHLDLDRDAGVKLINQIKADVGIDPGSVFFPVGERMKWVVPEAEVDLRVTLVPCVSGPKLAIRILDPNRFGKKIPDLGLTDEERERLDRWATEMNGMILVTGATGCGKTTTLYALLQELASEARHVVTVEDPVEYELDGINQIQVAEEHDLSFAEGIRASLRLDPDCLMIGEILEPESAQLAVNAAVQGHTVLGTLHSRDAVSAITRLRNFGVADHQIGAAIGVVVNQRLVRKLCPDCSSQRPPTEREIDLLTRHGRKLPDLVWEAKGCTHCNGIGYLHRTGIFEVWNLQECDYHRILNGSDEESIREGLSESDYISIFDDALEKIKSGITSVEEVSRASLEMPWSNR